MLNLNINGFKAVSFKESSVRKVVDSPLGAIASIKYDGLRCHLVIKSSGDIDGQPTARLYALSRTSKVIPALRELFTSTAHQVILGQFLEESLYPEGLVIDGEMMVKGVDFNTGSGMLRRNASLSPSELVYIVYGVLPLETLKDKSAEVPVTYPVMFEQVKVLIYQLKELLPELSWKQEETFEIYDMVSLNILYEDVRKQGHEGLIIKDQTCNWKRGKKTGMWKMKPDEEIDGVVVDVNWGTVGLANEGKIIGFSVLLENGVVVEANGISQEDMQEYTDSVISYGQYHYVGQADAEEAVFHGRPVQVRYMEKTPSGSLRHPSFQRWRDLEGTEGEKV